MMQVFAHSTAMAGATSKVDELETKAFEAFVASVLEDRESLPSMFYERADHRTYEWYITLLSQHLDEGAASHPIDLASYKANKNTKAMVAGMARAIHELFHKKNLMPQARIVIWALIDVGSTVEQRDRLAYHLAARLRDLVTYAKRLEDERETYRVVPAKKRKSPRDRAELPAPSEPAWSATNRMPSKDVQVSCRISEEVRDMMRQDADEDGISQSQWLNEAIVQKLFDEGYDVSIEKKFRASSTRNLQKRKAQRPSGERKDKKKSIHAAVNRQSVVTNLRVDPVLARQIDASLDDDGNRASWFDGAVRAHFYVRETLPASLAVRSNYAVALTLHFDRQLFKLIDTSVKQSGMTRSEWLRRVARWYLAYNSRV